MALFTTEGTNPDRQLQGIALCAGFGGLELGLAIAEPRHSTICFVEREAYPAATLVARMEDKALDYAPVWSDLKTFDGKPWRGKVDIITAGYPCQPFTFSGRRQGTADPRHLWPHVARVIDEIQPEWVFCENVEGHLNLGFSEVAGELQGMGFDVKAGLFSAYEVGASHQRRRLFVLAHANRSNGRQPDRNRDRHKRSVLFGGAGSKGLTGELAQCYHNLVTVLSGGKGVGDEGWQTANELPLFAPAPSDTRGDY